jgi:hypothetical protein
LLETSSYFEKKSSCHHHEQQSSPAGAATIRTRSPPGTSSFIVPTITVKKELGGLVTLEREVQEVMMKSYLKLYKEMRMEELMLAQRLTNEKLLKELQDLQKS